MAQIVKADLNHRASVFAAGLLSNVTPRILTACLNLEATRDVRGCKHNLLLINRVSVFFGHPLVKATTQLNKRVQGIACAWPLELEKLAEPHASKKTEFPWMQVSLLAEYKVQERNLVWLLKYNEDNSTINIETSRLTNRTFIPLLPT